MKKMQKIVGLFLALVMVLGMTTTAFAANITITEGAKGSEYTAYKLMNAEPLENEPTKYNFTINEKYANILATVTGKTEEADIIDYVAAIIDDSDDARAFADAVYDEITKATLAGDYTTKNDVFSGVDQGYYLIAETKVGDVSDTYSLVMLNTAGQDNIEIETKEDVPSVDKQVLEVNDSTGDKAWGESADHDVKDIVKYQIIGTVSNRYAEYESYYYSFEDTMDDGLTFNKDSIKVYVGGSLKADGTYDTATGTDVTSQFTFEKDDHSFTATANLKALTGVTITADTKIYVVYTATLNENAVKGTDGNLNEVVLKYENDPYRDFNPENPIVPPSTPGETPKDINIVFTFTGVVNKVDDKGAPLDKAGFTLYKFNGTDYAPVGEEMKGASTFRFEGLDAGKYKLVESTVPAGYNQAADVVFEVCAEYDETKDPVELTKLQIKDASGKVISEGDDAKFSIDNMFSTFTTEIVNKPGVVLPSTGGMGTTIFYVVGIILLIGSAVVLVTRKRMSK